MTAEYTGIAFSIVTLFFLMSCAPEEVCPGGSIENDGRCELVAVDATYPDLYEDNTDKTDIKQNDIESQHETSTTPETSTFDDAQKQESQETPDSGVTD